MRRRARSRHLHDLLRAVAVLLAPARSRDDRAPGGDRMVDLIDGSAAPRRCGPTSSACAPRSRPPAGRQGSVQILAAVKYVPVEELGELQRGRAHAARREPGTGSRRQGGRVSGRVHVGLHRRAAEPQGCADRPVRALHPFGRERLGAGAARAARDRADADHDRGQRRGRGRASPGSRPAELDGFLERSPGAGRRPDDDAAAGRATRS